VPHVDTAQAHLRWRAVHDHAPVGAQLDGDEVTLAKDTQCFVHHQGTDFEAADEIGPQPEPRARRNTV
jgi:hypothetical protein